MSDRADAIQLLREVADMLESVPGTDMRAEIKLEKTTPITAVDLMLQARKSYYKHPEEKRDFIYIGLDTRPT